MDDCNICEDCKFFITEELGDGYKVRICKYDLEPFYSSVEETYECENYKYYDTYEEYLKRKDGGRT